MKLIDADELIDFCEKGAEIYSGKENIGAIARADIYNEIRRWAKNTQTIDAQPTVHGHWIDTYGDSWICSECGVESYVDEDWKPKDDRAFKMNFCHYCDADMRNQKKENEGAHGEWISLGHRMGPMKHPWSEDYKCPFCGYEQYTVLSYPPESCPRCGAKLKGGSNGEG